MWKIQFSSFHTWGNSGIEPYSGSGNSALQETTRPTSWGLAITESRNGPLIGLDLSLKLTAICIVDQTGKINREGVVSSDPEAIAAFIRLHAPHAARVGLLDGSNVDVAVDRAE